MSDDTPPAEPIDRAARLRALEAARSVAFRHLVARMRGDLLHVLGCRLAGVDAEGGRIQLVAVGDQGVRTFGDLGVTVPPDRRRWFPFVSVAALAAKRKAMQTPPAPPSKDQGTP